VNTVESASNIWSSYGVRSGIRGHTGDLCSNLMIPLLEQFKLSHLSKILKCNMKFKPIWWIIDMTLKFTIYWNSKIVIHPSKKVSITAPKTKYFLLYLNFPLFIFKSDHQNQLVTNLRLVKISWIQKKSTKSWKIQNSRACYRWKCLSYFFDSIVLHINHFYLPV
jgi:hypothetical protein